MDFHLSSNDHHLNSLQHIAFNHHVRPRCLRSIFEDHSDLEIDNLAKPNPILRLKQSFDHSRLLATSSAPSWHFSLILSLLLWYPLWFPSFLHLHPIILPSLPLFQPTHYSLHIYDPKDHIMWRRHHGSQEGNALYQGRRLE